MAHFINSVIAQEVTIFIYLHAYLCMIYKILTTLITYLQVRISPEEGTTCHASLCGITDVVKSK